MSRFSSSRLVRVFSLLSVLSFFLKVLSRTRQKVSALNLGEWSDVSYPTALVRRVVLNSNNTVSFSLTGVIRASELRSEGVAVRKLDSISLTLPASQELLSTLLIWEEARVPVSGALSSQGVTGVSRFVMLGSDGTGIGKAMSLEDMQSMLESMSGSYNASEAFGFSPELFFDQEMYPSDPSEDDNE